MAQFHAVLFANLLVLTLVPAARAVTPVQQVVQMLTEMKTKGTSAMELEKKVMADYTKWVNDRVTDLGFEIKTAEGEVEKLTAAIGKAGNTISRLGSEIGELDAEIAQLEADKKAATDQRNTENKEYQKAQQDYSESVDALESAIQVLKSQAYDRPQAELLLQSAAGKTPALRRALAALLQEEKANGAPAVAAYEFQSDNVISVLEKLHEEFKSGLRDVETAEANAAHAYDLQMLHISNTLEYLSHHRGEKAVLKGQEQAEAAAFKGQLSETKVDLAEDKKLLAETQATFEVKKRTYEGNQQVRAEELEVIGKAIEILSDPTVAESYAKHINMLQTLAKPISSHVAFFQEKSERASQRALARDQAVELLRLRAKAISSKVLANAAADMAENPFAKVVEMIKELLDKLTEQASSEADHKQWCDGELKANKLRRNSATTAVERLSAEVEELAAKIAAMAAELATLSKEQASLATAMTEATVFRQREAAENEAAIKDASQAQEALKKALEILREFYASQASFVQRTKQVPEMQAYKGMQGSQKGIIGMLEVIESDFARLETDTRASETQAAEQYKEFMAESKASKESKHKLEVQLKLDKDQAEFEQGRKKDDLDAASKELAAANTYYDSLKPPCLVVHVSYEDRAARRKEEIAALKEAYEILDRKSTA
mmetsp:Transcript_138033/g.385062  ORF Transcript_138033/g.385062 Transcript_138033/m.385062 type:complete len:665 (+) Transcript_138033:95-2089(+)